MSTYKRLQYSPFDILIVLVGLACIVGGSFYFAKDSYNSGNFRLNEKFGDILSGKGSRKLGSSLQFFNVGRNTELYYGDVIFANEQKAIEIGLLDKSSKFVVPIDSMVKITKSGDEFNLDVSKGSILINSNKNRKFKIKDKRGKVRKVTVSKNSQVKISTKKSNVMVEALKGKATIQKVRTKETLQVEKGKVLLVGPKESKVVNKVQIIAQKIIDPLFKSTITLTEKFKELRTVEIADSSEFKDSTFLPVIRGVVDISALSQGTYYIRINEKDGYDEFEIKSVKSPILKIKEKEKYYQGDSIVLSWNSRPELMYRVDVTGDGDFSKLVQGNQFKYLVQDSGNFEFEITEQKYERKSNKESITIEVQKDLGILGFEESDDPYSRNKVFNLKNPRKIKYRLVVKNHEGKTASNKIISDETIKLTRLRPGKFSFSLINLKTESPYFSDEFIVGDQITNNRTKKNIVVEDGKMNATFKWKRKGNFPEELTYILRVLNGENIILEKELDETSYEYEFEKEGDYSWEVQAKDVEFVSGIKGIPLKIGRPSIANLTSPKIILEYIESGDCYKFTLPTNKYAKIYDTFIYSSRVKVKGNWKLMYRKRLEVNNDCIPSKGEGKYYYKYKIIDKWDRSSKFSKFGEIYFPISPLDDF